MLFSNDYDTFHENLTQNTNRDYRTIEHIDSLSLVTSSKQKVTNWQKNTAFKNYIDEVLNTVTILILWLCEKEWPNLWLIQRIWINLLL